MTWKNWYKGRSPLTSPLPGASRDTNPERRKPLKGRRTREDPECLQKEVAHHSARVPPIDRGSENQGAAGKQLPAQKLEGGVLIAALLCRCADPGKAILASRHYVVCHLNQFCTGTCLSCTLKSGSYQLVRPPVPIRASYDSDNCPFAFHLLCSSLIVLHPLSRARVALPGSREAPPRTVQRNLPLPWRRFQCALHGPWAEWDDWHQPQG